MLFPCSALLMDSPLNRAYISNRLNHIRCYTLFLVSPLKGIHALKFHGGFFLHSQGHRQTQKIFVNGNRNRIGKIRWLYRIVRIGCLFSGCDESRSVGWLLPSCFLPPLLSAVCHVLMLYCNCNCINGQTVSDASVPLKSVWLCVVLYCSDYELE